MSDPLKDVKEVKEILNLHYEIIKIDLTKARTLKDIEIHPYKVEYYNELKILRSDSAFDIILNDTENDAIPIREDDLTTILLFKIKELYVTNSEGTGTAVLMLSSRLD